MQKSKSDTKIVYQNDEKTRLQTELDSLEAQIEQVNAGRAKMSTEMQAENDSLRAEDQSAKKRSWQKANLP
jgi:peptidoglycan hydrolase CwlO-like protein